MTWSIAVVAHMTGATSRTLRHDDEIGLLPPAGTAASGHRLCDDGQLLRRHDQHLRAEAERPVRLADTVVHVTGGTTSTAPQVFEGFQGDRAATEEQLVARYGDGVREHSTTARARTPDWTVSEFDGARREMAELDDRAVACWGRARRPPTRG